MRKRAASRTKLCCSTWVAGPGLHHVLNLSHVLTGSRGEFDRWRLLPSHTFLQLLALLVISFHCSGLQSWWYPKGTGDGVLNWTAMPTIFPGGNAGIRNLTATTGWKVIAHNRYWSNDTTYASQSGGPWEFYIDNANSPAGGETSLPLQRRFWESLLTDSVKER